MPDSSADPTAAEPRDDETTDAAAPAPVTPSTPKLGAAALLTRASDLAARPGFRNPANSRSKAQKGKKRR